MGINYGFQGNLSILKSGLYFPESCRESEGESTGGEEEAQVNPIHS